MPFEGAARGSRPSSSPWVPVPWLGATDLNNWYSTASTSKSSRHERSGRRLVGKAHGRTGRDPSVALVHAATSQPMEGWMAAKSSTDERTTDRRAAWPLSNFERVVGLELDGVEYQTAEHLFQALKTDDLAWRERIRTATSPVTAKRLGRKVPLRDYWDEIKLTVMKTVLRRKFRLDPFRSRLLTWEGPIVERTTWHDRYWGVCVCPKHMGEGENHLGQLLEEVRAELLAGSTE